VRHIVVKTRQNLAGRRGRPIHGAEENARAPARDRYDGRSQRSRFDGIFDRSHDDSVLEDCDDHSAGGEIRDDLFDAVVGFLIAGEGARADRNKKRRKENKCG
jgi:hypothetical protein